jgi:hypothetical protein
MEESLFLIFAPQSYEQIPCQTSYQQLFSQKNYFFCYFLPFRKQKRHFHFHFRTKIDKQQTISHERHLHKIKK